MFLPPLEKYTYELLNILKLHAAYLGKKMKSSINITHLIMAYCLNITLSDKNGFFHCPIIINSPYLEVEVHVKLLIYKNILLVLDL